MKRSITSGWCETEHHGRCVFVLQDANERRPRIECGCSCHAATRAALAEAAAQTG